MVKPEHLTTPRLILRQWTPQDLPEFAALNADPEVMRYFPSTLDRQASDALAAKAQAFLQGRNYVAPDDIAAILPQTAAHRLVPVSDAGRGAMEQVRAMIDATPIP